MKSGMSNPRTIGLFLALAALLFMVVGGLTDAAVTDVATLFQALWANAGAELASIALTVLIIDDLNEQRSARQEKETLIAQLHSKDQSVTQNAISVLWLRGWLQDGSVRKANLKRANLENGDLGECDLRGAQLNRANLRHARLWADLRGASLLGADLTAALLKDPAYPPGVREVIFDEHTVLPDGSHWSPDTDMTRFLDPAHPAYWRSGDIESPAYQPDGHNGTGQSIAVCGSGRHIDRIMALCDALEAQGYLVMRPVMGGDVSHLTPSEALLAWGGAAQKHLRQIRQADICLIANFNGYLGVDSTIELGYASALHKWVVALNHDDELGREALFDRVLETNDVEAIVNSLRSSS